MRGPLFILIPLGAILAAAAIGISIGLMNLAVRDAFDSAVAPVVSAGSLTIIIMAVATYLHLRAPDPEE
jgi:hypothetical protein